MKTHEFLLLRDTYTSQTTIGKIHAPNGYFSESLEDTVRATGVKVINHTAIPAGRYRLKVTRSPRFKRDMVLIYNQKDYSLKANGIRFTGLRVHGGNDHGDTSGCILSAKNRLSKTKIQGTREKAFTAKVKALSKTGDCYITIVNLPQAK